MDLRSDREALFANLSEPAIIPTFFDRVADDVRWTVEGVHPIAGTYTSKRRSPEAPSTGSRP